MSRRLLPGAAAAAISLTFAAAAAAQAAPVAAHPAPATHPASATGHAAARSAARPEANVIRTMDGRQVAVPQAAAVPAVIGPPRPTPSGPALYVNSTKGSGCTDTGAAAGSQAVPFCTLQAAANAVVPGDTVLVTPGMYTSFTLSAQGTATSPIVFESSVVATNPIFNESIHIQDPNTAGVASSAHAIEVSHSSFVDLENFQVTGLESSDALLIDASDHVTVNDFMDWVAYFDSHPQTAPDIHVTNGSSQVTLTRATLFNNASAPYVRSDGSSHLTVADSAFRGGSIGVTVTDTPDTAITGNTFWSGNSKAISLTGASPNSTVADNIVDFSGSSGSPSIAVGPDATNGTTVDYNTVQPSPAAYQWGADSYASSAALHSATGQGAHDIYAATHVYIGGNVLMLDYDSLGINAADASAPGEQSTDIYGQGCVQDPSYPVTGAGDPAYCSRGSFQFQDPLGAELTTTASGSMSVRADATKSHGLHPVTSYSFDFGDGSSPVVTSTGQYTYTYPHSGYYYVTVTVTDSTGATNTSSSSYVSTTGADFGAMAPVRVLDTRDGTGTGQKGAVRAGSNVTFPVPPAAAAHGNLLKAIVLNVTVTAPTGSGYVGVGAGTSSLNFTPGQTVAATVIAEPENVNGQLVAYVQTTGSGTLQVIADMSGYFALNSTDGYHSITPTRLLDTRAGTGGSTGPLGSTQPDVLTVAGTASGAIPSQHVTAVAANLTVTGTTGSGLVTAYPDGSPKPGTSNINYTPGQTVSNFAILPVGADGKIDFIGAGSARTQLIVDVLGYFDTEGGSGFVAADPYREIDTRGADPTAPCNSARGALGPGRVLTTDVTCPTGYPAPANLGQVTAVVLNDTVTATTSAGYLTVYPAGAAPTTSSVNWQGAGLTVSNLTFAGTGTGGKVSFANRAGSTQLIVDVSGYFASS